MKIGVISDIHGNHAALAAVAARLFGAVDRVFFLGDVFGYYGFATECLRLLETLDVVGLRGNHDQVLVDWLVGGNPPPESYRQRYGSALERAASQLSSEDLVLVSSWPALRTIEVEGKRIVMCHGAPWGPLEARVYPDFSDWSRFDGLDADLVLMGHTHYPLVQRLGGQLVVNPGSVGQPRDASGAACFAIVDLHGLEATLLRECYDCRAILDDARAHDPGLPYLVQVLTR